MDSLKYCNIAYDYEIPEFFFDRNSDNFLAILGKKSLFHIVSSHGGLGGKVTNNVQTQLSFAAGVSWLDISVFNEAPKSL